MTGVVDQPATVLEPFDQRHVAAAAELVAGRVREDLAATPILPARQAEPGVLADVLEQLAARGSGVAAMRDGRLVGFLAAWILAEESGDWAYSPDSGHAAAGDDRGVVEALYSRLAADWVERGSVVHVIAVSARDQVTIDAYSWLGFGIHTVDLVRDLSPVPVAAAPAITIRAASVADVEVFTALEDGLRAHLAASPTFLPWPPRPREELLRRLADPAAPTFLAEDADGAAIAYLRIGPCATDVAMIVRHPGTASISGAFTVADRRGEDVASALLDHAIGWARGEGYARCAVDHESANLLASRFWGRHFTPVTLSLLRRVR